jgi:hypothetical protein
VHVAGATAAAARHRRNNDVELGGFIGLCS